MYDNILVPIDGSATSRKAMEEATRLARLTGGRIRLLHVVDPLSHTNGFFTPDVYLGDLQPALLEAGRKLVEQARDEIATGGLRVETDVRETGGLRVSEAIVDDARSWGADIIVLGTHGRRGIERVMVGSDAEQVVRASPVPVLLVRHPG